MNLAEQPCLRQGGIHWGVKLLALERGAGFHFLIKTTFTTNYSPAPCDGGDF
jgi:hypothetical protein